MQVRLQHLSPAFLGSVLKRLPVMANVATGEALMAAGGLRFYRAQQRHET
jgi:hypothetical protein